jgi:hypothetical protein
MKAPTSSALIFAFMLAGVASAAEPRDACAHDVLRVDGTPVDVLLCAPSAAAPRKAEGRPVEVSVAETFTANGSSFSRTVSLEFLEGPQTSRTIDDVALDKLGIPKALHLTIGYRGGVMRLEHAMLVPGAISLK